MPVSKFTYRKREFKDFKDVKDAVEELAFQAEKEFRAFEKSAIPASQVIVQSTPTPSSKTAFNPISESSVDYRADAMVVSAGTNTITFKKNLSTSSYVVLWALFTPTGELSSATPDITSFSVSGFNITCLEAGILHYRVDIPK